jgi:DNA-binding beta-propeller fold protein YncE
VKLLSLRIIGSEPTGFIFSPDGTTAYVTVQHSDDWTTDSEGCDDDVEILPDGGVPDDFCTADEDLSFDSYGTDDVLVISGFSPPAVGQTFGADWQDEMHSQVSELFGFDSVLTESAEFGQ